SGVRSGPDARAQSVAPAPPVPGPRRGRDSSARRAEGRDLGRRTLQVFKAAPRRSRIRRRARRASQIDPSSWDEASLFQGRPPVQYISGGDRYPGLMRSAAEGCPNVMEGASGERERDLDTELMMVADQQPFAGAVDP